MHFLNENSINNPENVVVAEKSDQNGVFSSIGGNNFQGTAASGYVTSRNIISGEYFTVGELTNIITISNVITPNNDNINDYLYISNIEDYSDNEIIILNKTGNKVYSEKNYQNNWNGTVKGEYLPEGSYICIFRINDMKSEFTQIFNILK